LNHILQILEQSTKYESYKSSGYLYRIQWKIYP